MTTIRFPISDFQLANPLYTAAQVSFFTVDASGHVTATLATLYADPVSNTTAANPQTLDGEGKFLAPVYIATPVIASVVGPNVGSHVTGVIDARGTWKGNWAPATAYFSNDFVQDPATAFVYVAASDFTSNAASITADITAGNLVLVLGQPSTGGASSAIHLPVRVATTAPITLSGLQTVDGVALAAGDRALVWYEADQTTNGIYLAASGAWVRASDMLTGNQLTQGTMVTVAQGAIWADAVFQLTSSGPVTIGITKITFSPMPLPTQNLMWNGDFSQWTTRPLGQNSVEVNSPGGNAGFLRNSLPDGHYMAPGQGTIAFSAPIDDTAIGSHYAKIRWLNPLTSIANSDYPGVNRFDWFEWDNLLNVELGANQDLSIEFDAMADAPRNIIPGVFVSMGNEVWVQSQAVNVGDIRIVAANSLVYVCATAGTTSNSGTGPTGTGTGITDGTAAWNYRGPLRGTEYELFQASGTPGVASIAYNQTPGPSQIAALTTSWQSFRFVVTIPPIDRVNATDYVATADPSRQLTPPNSHGPFHAYLGVNITLYAPSLPITPTINLRKFKVYVGATRKAVLPTPNILKRLLASEFVGLALPEVYGTPAEGTGITELVLQGTSEAGTSPIIFRSGPGVETARFDANGNLGINTGATVNAPLHIKQNANSAVHALVENPSTGAAAAASYIATNSANSGTFGIGSTGYSGIAILINRAFVDASSGASGIVINNEGANPIIFGISSTQVGQIQNGLAVGPSGTADPGTGIINVSVGYRVGNAAAAGNVLRGNGSSFVSAALSATDLSTPAVVRVSTQAFLAGGTYTPHPNLLFAIIECIGGGGGGGGANGVAGQSVGGGGGGSGGYSRSYVSAATIGASQTVTVGVAGTAGAAGSNAGGNGGDTSVGTLCIGKGGSGGAGGVSGTSGGAGGAGGVAGTGDFANLGSPGGAGFSASIITVILSSGYGAASAFGGGAAGVTGTTATAGTAAAGAGGGGSGGMAYNNVGGNAAGGAGFHGAVVITEFSAA